MSYRHIFVVLVSFAVLSPARSQEASGPGSVQTGSEGEDIVPIEFELWRVGRVELVSVVRDRRVFLPAGALFNFLKIKNSYDPASGVFAGYFVTPDTPYAISIATGRAEVGRKVFHLSRDDYFYREGEFYLGYDLYRLIFGLPIRYSPRLLKAELRTRTPLPIFLEQRLQKMERGVIHRERSAPEWSYPRHFSFLDGARMDWTLRQTLFSQRYPTRSFSTRMGFTFLGGDTEARIAGTASPAVRIDQSRVRWRLVPENAGSTPQIQLGHLTTSGLVSREILGAEITTRPASRRLLFAYEPVTARGVGNRKVFLYRDGQLSDVETLSPDGTYTFEAPVKYGASLVEVRSFSEWGELFEDSYRILVPPSMIPPNEIEYGVIGGKLSDGRRGRIGEASFHWGLSSRLTVGGNTTYLSEGTSSWQIIPSLDAVMRLTNHLVGEALFSPNAFARAGASMTLPSLVSATFTYTHYQPSRLFNPRRAVNEKFLAVGLPFSVNGGRFAVDFSGHQTVLKLQREDNLRLGLGVFAGIFSPRITTQQRWISRYDIDLVERTDWQTDASLRTRLPANLYLTTAARYDHLIKRMREVRIDALVHPFQRLSVEVFYNRRLVVQQAMVGVNLQYLFPSTRLALTAARMPQGMRYAQTLSGSLGYSLGTGDAFFDYIASRSGYGSLFVVPFVDENNNGVRDGNEPVIEQAKVRASTIYGEGTSLSWYPQRGWGTLRSLPYERYVIEVDKSGFENPLWVPRYKTFTVISEPGRFVYVELPILPGGAIRGTVRLRDDAQQLRPIGGLTVRLRMIPQNGAEEGVDVERTTETFSNGDFEFLAVVPGDYELSLNPEQLNLLGLKPDPPLRRVTVESLVDGHFVEGVDFLARENRQR